MEEGLRDGEPRQRVHLRPKLVALLVAGLAVLAYLPTLDGSFFSDDFAYVAGNERLQSIPLTQPWRFFAARTNPYEYLPLRDLSYRLDYALFGLEPAGYHAHNLLLYAACCVAAWVLARNLLVLLWPDRDAKSLAWACAAITALFAVHPAHVESVAWISGRKDLLSGLLGLLSLGLFCRSLRDRKPDLRRLGASYALFVLALLSKTTVLPLAVVAFLMAVAAARRRRAGWSAWARAALLAAPFAVIAGAFLWLSLKVGADSSTRVTPFVAHALTWPDRLDAAVKILGALTRIALFPARLRLLYDLNEPGASTVLLYVLGGAALVAACLGAWLLLRRRSAAGLATTAFVLLCLPFLQLVPFDTWSRASERFLFLPVFAVALLLAAVADRLSYRARKHLLGALVIAGLAATIHQSFAWRDPNRLWVPTAARSPGLYLAQQMLIDTVYLPRGRYADAEAAAARIRDPYGREALRRYIGALRARDEGDWEEAERQARWLENVLGRGFHPRLQLLVGSIYEHNGKPLEAIRYYHGASRESRLHQDMRHSREALKRIRSAYLGRLEKLCSRATERPNDIVALGEYANLQKELFFLDQAEASYRRILDRFPKNPVAHFNLGLTHAHQNRDAEAAEQFRAAIEAGFRTGDVWNRLALAYERLVLLEAAEHAFRQALETDPAHWHAAFNLGRMCRATGRTADARKAFLEGRRRCARAGGPASLFDLYLSELGPG